MSWDMMGGMKTLNFKLDETASALFDALKPRAAAALGFEPSQSQLVALALKALSDRYDAEDAAREQKTRGRKHGE